MAVVRRGGIRFQEIRISQQKITEISRAHRA